MGQIAHRRQFRILCDFRLERDELPSVDQLFTRINYHFLIDDRDRWRVYGRCDVLAYMLMRGLRS